MIPLSLLTSFTYYYFTPLITILFIYRFIFIPIYTQHINHKRLKTITFFHPYCIAGGGGERVLWITVAALLQHEECTIYIYSGDISSSKDNILEAVHKAFGINLNATESSRLHFVTIHTRFLLEAKWYPILTMLLQSLASIIVAIECITKHSPTTLIDTIGAPFIYPVFKAVCNPRIIAYVHYPIISTDMLAKVAEQRPTSAAPSAAAKTQLKLLYYQLFARLYGVIGYFADVCVVNSSWTEEHIRSLWTFNKTIIKIFPPCNTDDLANIDISHNRRQTILSVGQFRPEKDHLLQMRVFRRLQNEEPCSDAVLTMLGSTRSEVDRAYVKSLHAAARVCCEGDTCRVFDDPCGGNDDLSRTIGGIRFIVDAPYSVVRDELGEAAVGLHTMWNEHFGISVVEMMAAGLMVVAHKSGGPRMDILSHEVIACGAGYLAASEDEYLNSLKAALLKCTDNYVAADLRKVARKNANRFSDDEFTSKIVSLILYDKLVNI